MKSGLSILLSMVILLMFSVTGIHGQIDLQGSGSETTIENVSAHADHPVETNAEHACHFGHAAHCGFNVPQVLVFNFNRPDFKLLAEYKFSHINPVVEALKRPPRV